jgi:hypothetical protein
VRGALGAVAVGWLLAAGCVSAEPADRPPPKQPSWAKPSDLLVSSGFPEDIDGNGYLDTMAMTVYVFDAQFPGASIQAPGTFAFALTTPDGKPIARWDLTIEETTAAARPMPPGPGYLFKLSLLDKGGDKINTRVAELSTVFTPVTGKPVRAKSLTVTFGQTGARTGGTP